MNDETLKDHLDNDKDLREIIADIIESTGVEHGNEFWHRDSSLSYADRIIEATEAYTQSKLKAFAGDIEKAIGEDVPLNGLRHPEEDEWHNTRNKLKSELRKALKAIKEKYQL